MVWPQSDPIKRLPLNNEVYKNISQVNITKQNILQVNIT
jgi:hypothetical protein